MGRINIEYILADFQSEKLVVGGQVQEQQLGNMNKMNKYIGILPITIIIIITIIVESPFARNNRFDNLTAEFEKSEFSGVVTMITQDKSDHNSWKIYFGKDNSLDLTWFENKAELINRIHAGDSISKSKNSETIRIFSRATDFEIKVIIIR